MTKEYGTPNYYAELFSDFIADIQSDSPEFGDNLIEGFLMAIDDWRKYHVNQILELDRVEFNLNEKIGLQKTAT